MSLEKHLREIGIMPSTLLEEIASVPDTRMQYAVKGYYNDPRDGNMEVPF